MSAQIANADVNLQYQTLGLPPQYKGSNMFMPGGERLYWQAEVLLPPYGPGTTQDFEEIRSRCLSEGVLFEDPEFPASDHSLYKDEKQKRKIKLASNDIEWVRPSNINANPQFKVDGVSQFDVKLNVAFGRLHLISSQENGWFSDVLATLAMQKKLFDLVVPSDQSFDKNYAGVFHFRFWQYGRWVDVVIDDRLPIHRERFRSLTIKEFWSALLEKAYAKLYGSYGAIAEVVKVEALEDFSGGLFEIYNDVTNLPKNFFSHMHLAHLRNSLFETDLLDTMRKPWGFLSGHWYSITSVNYLECGTPLLRIQNPWGFSKSTEPLMDNDPEWKLITKEKEKALGLSIDNDEEFWMYFEDFTKYFSSVSICSMNPLLYPSENSENITLKWHLSITEGKWVSGETAGGSDLYPESYWRNPQHIITVTDSDEGTEENICTVLVSLTQKYGRTYHGHDFLSIGFKVHSIGDVEPNGTLDEKFFSKNKAINDIYGGTTNIRGWNITMKIKPGCYVIIPFLEKPDEEGEFILRVLSAKSHIITKPCAVVQKNHTEDNEICCNDTDDDNKVDSDGDSDNETIYNVTLLC